MIPGQAVKLTLMNRRNQNKIAIDSSSISKLTPKFKIPKAFDKIELPMIDSRQVAKGLGLNKSAEDELKSSVDDWMKLSNPISFMKSVIDGLKSFAPNNPDFRNEVYQRCRKLWKNKNTNDPILKIKNVERNIIQKSEKENKMPANVVKTQRDEHLWKEAKKQAKKQGRTGDYQYIMGIFQRMKGNKSMEKGEKIPGGLASGKKKEDFNQVSLNQGIKVELEHTKNKNIAAEIAMDHLTEDPKYYDKLKRIEKSQFDLCKSLYSRDDVIGWAGQFYGTPLYIDALNCLKEESEIDQNRKKIINSQMSWDELQELPAKQRQKQREKQDKALEPIRKKESLLADKKLNLENRLIDHKIEEAKKFGKSFLGPDDLRESFNHSIISMIKSLPPNGKPGSSKTPPKGYPESKKQYADPFKKFKIELGEQSGLPSVEKSMPQSEIMMFGSVPIIIGGNDHFIETLINGHPTELGAHASGRPSLKKGTISQNESLSPAGGDFREVIARANLSDEIVVLDQDGTNGNGGLIEWWNEKIKINEVERVPVGQGMIKSFNHSKDVVIEYDNTYRRHINKMNYSDGQANLDYLFNKKDQDIRV